MSKYSFGRITPDDFESMAQALLEKTYRIGGNLIQFGPGADGGREATWTQPVTHPNYCRPHTEQTDVPREWVFQVKYHNIGQRGWTTVRDAVVEELEQELDKIVNKHKVPCHTYVMITNAPFTGVRDLGTRDRISSVARKWKDRVPDVFVWDAADLSRLLDANDSVRTAYLETILPGDLIQAIFKNTTFRENRTRSALRAYLEFVTEREGVARAEEAGDEPGLPLVDVFIDLSLKNCNKSLWDPDHRATRRRHEEKGPSTRFLPKDSSKVPSSFAFLIADHYRSLLLGGPGLGKSTVTQFVALYHASRLVAPDYARRLAVRLKLPTHFSHEDLDAHCRLRIPFRLELRRYARWMREEQKFGRLGEIARYIAEMLINPNVSSSLNMEDVFAVAASDPVLLILDGLDEVPHPEDRKQIRENLQAFLRRAYAENSDIQLLFSSRPKGYSGEFTVFEPITWELNDLDRTDFNDYCDHWLDKRIRDAAERSEARERIDRGMKSEAVQRLAQSLLQATVMLTIVRRKSEIPHQRHALYAKYVDVIFDREKEKSQIVRDHETVLRRLHERIGYEMHRKMEQTSVEALDSKSFRNYVLNVLEDYSGTELGQRKIREVADEIITAATDRLCLLVGKGNEQADIDFVVQSYREYFAAVYLFNHPEADPDRVFSALVRRGAYWANVLQFYVAQANANQQMRWVISADGSDLDMGSIDTIVDLARVRRALLNVLPEFNLQRKSDFDRALGVIFHHTTRWTWLKQSNVHDLLRVLRSGCSQKILSEFIHNLTTDDAGTLAVELWILTGLTSRDSRDIGSISTSIEALLQKKDACPVALATSIENLLPVDLSLCDISLLRQPGVVFDNKLPSNLFSRQSPEKQCELLLAGFEPKIQQSPMFHAIQIQNTLASCSEIKLLNSHISLRCHPYLCRSPQSVTGLADIRDALLGIRNPNAAYMGTIAHAAMDPLNLELDLRAREMEPSIRKDGVEIWCAESILGPAHDVFSSQGEWAEFKRELGRISSKDPEWFSGFEVLRNSDSAWTALLFHPEEWPLLVEEYLLSRDDHDALVHSPFGQLFSRPLIQLSAGWNWTAESRTKHNVPLRDLLGAALQVAETKGLYRIDRGSLLSGMLCYGSVKTTTKQEVDGLLHRALALPPLHPDWYGAMLRLCIETPGTDIDLLLRFWEHAEGQPCGVISIPQEVLPEGGNEIINHLLDLDQTDALQLATTILSCGRARGETTMRFLKKIKHSSFFPGDKDASYFHVKSITSQVASLEEFQIWERWDDATATACGKYPWLFRQILNRFEEVVQAEEIFDSCELRKRFATFIIQRRNFPWQLPCSALEAALILDERDAAPLYDVDWQ